MGDLGFQTATALAQLIQQRQVSSAEVVDALLDRIARLNPRLNAIVTLDEGGARRRAQEADEALSRGQVWGPLHGVPITVKDAYETAGMRTTSGHKPLADYVPQQDAVVVERMRAAGAIVLGKTNMPELAMDMQTNSPLLGRAVNPWDVERTTGGSTGGEAAALAAGLSPLGLGSDLAGSLRFPAHCCGVLSLKPTEGRVSGVGHIPPPPGEPGGLPYMAAFGPLARSVADLRLGLSLISGPDARDPTVPPVPLAAVPKRPLAEYRFAWTDRFGDVGVSAKTGQALARLADDLARAGCQVERTTPAGFEFDLAWQTFGEFLGYVVGLSSPPLQRMAYRVFGPALFKDPMISAGMRVVNLDMHRLVETLARRNRLTAALERFLAGYDAWLCPVAPGPAFRHCRLGPVGQPVEVDGQWLPYWTACASYTGVFNLTGSPVVVLPLAQSSEGLPIGVQVVGRRWDEMALLNAAEALMEVLGPVRRPPGY